MAGQWLSAAYIHEGGVNGDRLFAFRDTKTHRESLPYLTARERHDMILAQPFLLNEPDVDERYPHSFEARAIVDLTGYGYLPITSPNLLEHIAEPGRISVEYSPHGIKDKSDISLISMATIEHIAHELGEHPAPMRFRANIYMTSDPEPFLEDRLIGKHITIGSVMLRIDDRIRRCSIPCLKPQTAEYDERILTLLSERGGYAGVHASVIAPGTVRNGFAIRTL